METHVWRFDFYAKTTAHNQHFPFNFGFDSRFPRETWGLAVSRAFANFRISYWFTPISAFKRVTSSRICCSTVAVRDWLGLSPQCFLFRSAKPTHVTSKQDPGSQLTPRCVQIWRNARKKFIQNGISGVCSVLQRALPIRVWSYKLGAVENPPFTDLVPLLGKGVGKNFSQAYKVSTVIIYTRWWFEMFFIFTPTWGRFPFWLIFFKWVETTNQYIYTYLCTPSENNDGPPPKNGSFWGSRTSYSPAIRPFVSSPGGWRSASHLLTLLYAGGFQGSVITVNTAMLACMKVPLMHRGMK